MLILAALFVIGRIRAGIFTVVEAAAMGAVPTVLRALRTRRRPAVRFLRGAARSGQDHGVAVLHPERAQFCAAILALTRVPVDRGAAIDAPGPSPRSILVLIRRVRIVLGTVMDGAR